MEEWQILILETFPTETQLRMNKISKVQLLMGESVHSPWNKRELEEGIRRNFPAFRPALNA